MQETKPSVLVCVLCGPERDHWINPRLVVTLLKMQSDNRFTVEIEFIHGMHGIDRARNLAIDKAREIQADWLMQIDNDISHAAPLDVLAEANGAGLDIIAVSSGLSLKEGTYQPNVDLAGDRCGNFMRVSNAGAGLLMIRSSVWNKLPKGPLFVWSADCGEDVYFARLAQALGFKLWTHASLADHFKTVNITSLLKGTR